MSVLTKKIDFVAFFTVTNANPNGDPLNGNMPRTDYDGYGEVSDVCIKRKIRNRMQDAGNLIFVQSNDRIEDEFKSLEKRFNATFKKETDDVIYTESCKKWLDVRSFGQVITFQNKSIGIRGPVSISLGKSIVPVEVTSMQITRSTNGMASEEGKRSSDTMGTKHYVNHGVYRITGSINPFFSEKTGFTDEDAETVKETLKSLFVNDASSARPEGSMEINRIYWFTHPDKLGLASSAKIHNLVISKVRDDVSKPSSFEDYDIQLIKDKVDSYKNRGLNIEEIEGL